LTLEFRRERFDSAAAVALVQAQEEEVRRRGDDGDIAAPRDPTEFEPPDGVFVVMFDDETPVGCGGACRFDATRAELKRMYVAPEARGGGRGRLLLQRIEDEARLLGYGGIVLETITLMTEALGLYRSSGYEPIAAYGPYAASPTSRCFEKPL
jgi:GNAT superfamily N-acetyltransferase